MCKNFFGVTLTEYAMFNLEVVINNMITSGSIFICARYIIYGCKSIYILISLNDSSRSFSGALDMAPFCSFALFPSLIFFWGGEDIVIQQYSSMIGSSLFADLDHTAIKISKSAQVSINQRDIKLLDYIRLILLKYYSLLTLLFC